VLKEPFPTFLLLVTIAKTARYAVLATAPQALWADVQPA
jgi:membrane protein YqaA with SNARE-associated domain